jgi:hypothetical protein
MVANNLAMAYRDQQKLDDAAVLMQRSLGAREAVNGPDHLDVALALGSLAGIERARGRYTEAETASLRAVAIIEAQAGPEPPGVGILITELADGYRAQGRLTRPSRCIGARPRSSSTRPGGITRWC